MQPVPLTADAVDTDAAVPVHRVEALGFSLIERTVFVSTFVLSQRRRRRYVQHVLGSGPCDLLLVNADDPAALESLTRHPQHDRVPTILVGDGGDPHALRLSRPIRWMALFETLDEAIGGGPAEAAVHDGPKAMVITPSAQLARMVGVHFTGAGCRVEQLVDGESAIDRLASARVDCLFVDAALPGIGGIDVARRAKSGAARSVIVLGTSGTPLERMRASMAGCDVYLPPPLDGSRLIDAIARCVR